MAIPLLSGGAPQGIGTISGHFFAPIFIRIRSQGRLLQGARALGSENRSCPFGYRVRCALCIGGSVPLTVPSP